jgi:hypothetical protein
MRKALLSCMLCIFVSQGIIFAARSKVASYQGVPLQFMLPKSYDTLQQGMRKKVNQKKVYFNRMEDIRPDPALLGDYTNGAVTRVVSTSDTVSQWVRRYLSSLLDHYGVTITTDSAAADLRLFANIQAFEVEERKEYKGSIKIDISLQDSNGKEVFAKKISSEASRWGRTWKIKNYYQCISETLLNFAESLVQDEDFIKAVQ